jgi:hypothetical protein
MEDGMPNRSQINSVLGSIVAAALACAAPVWAQDKTKLPLETVGTTEAVTVDATVEDIDLGTRTVTLAGPGGDTFVVTAGDRVKNLDQVRKGDRVSTTFYRSLALDVRKGGAGSSQPSATGDVAVATAAPGERPGGVAVKRLKVLVDVAGVNKDKPSITVIGPAGKPRELLVKDRALLDGVTAGEQVEVDYTEALAIAVEPKR